MSWQRRLAALFFNRAETALLQVKTAKLCANQLSDRIRISEVQNDVGYWVKVEVSRVKVTGERPHGIRYSLTLHAPDNTRLIGFDNAHSVRPVGSNFKHAGKKYPYDHRHRHVLDEGVLYEFDTAYQLVSDFYAEVDRVLKEICP